jgi:hypothetical protein
MPFPFIPAGLLLAIAVLAITLVAFGLALKALDWSIDAARRSALAGIVTGLRSWEIQPPTQAAPTPPPSTEVEDEDGVFEELVPVSPDRTHRRRAD